MAEVDENANCIQEELPPVQNIGEGDKMSSEDIYAFYRDTLLPSIISSLPILMGRISRDLWNTLLSIGSSTLRFLLPYRSSTIINASQTATNQTTHFINHLLRQFDTNQDGHISATEIMQSRENLTEWFSQIQPPVEWTWWHSAWPMTDWKLGVFLWRSCGGLLLLIALASIVPGRTHVLAGRLLRWPVLGMTYVVIGVELVVYVLLRFFIRLVEGLIANPRHRALRRKMREAKSYREWYEIAEALDKSQGRDKWQRTTSDDMSYRYNWAFVRSLMADMRDARKNNDSLQALAVLQQCTRKNVGGVMSEELFSQTNTGQPKDIVVEFLDEVSTTLKWVTMQARDIPLESHEDAQVVENQNGEGESFDKADEKMSEEKYEVKLKMKIQQEREKIYSSLMTFATLAFLGGSSTELSDHPIPTTDTVATSSSSSSPTSSPKQNSQPSPIPRKKSIHDFKTLPSLHRSKVKIFLKRARAAYGRTALCLSGRGMMGNYHFGAVKALLDAGLLPDIISGTSAGSVMRALLCTRTDVRYN